MVKQRLLNFIQYLQFTESLSYYQTSLLKITERKIQREKKKINIKTQKIISFTLKRIEFETCGENISVLLCECDGENI